MAHGDYLGVTDRLVMMVQVSDRQSRSDATARLGRYRRFKKGNFLDLVDLKTADHPPRCRHCVAGILSSEESKQDLRENLRLRFAPHRSRNPREIRPVRDHHGHERVGWTSARCELIHGVW